MIIANKIRTPVVIKKITISLKFFIIYFPPNVFTLVGLPPGLPAALFRLTADAFCELVIAVAFASGTHFGYFLDEELADFLPHS
jgi:hypothetical protein